MNPKAKLLWSAYLYQHGKGQDLIDEIERLEARIAELEAEKTARTGPGTPAYRFFRLIEALEQRFPDPEPFRSDRPPEQYYLGQIDKLRAGFAITPTRPSIVMVEIPEPDEEDGGCYIECPLYCCSEEKCRKELGEHIGHRMYPGPNCPRGDKTTLSGIMEQVSEKNKLSRDWFTFHKVKNRGEWDCKILIRMEETEGTTEYIFIGIGPTPEAALAAAMREMG